jgi:hypothetical protein
MTRQRRTADDFVRDMKAKQQQHSTPSDIERKPSEGQSEGCSADPRTGRRVPAKLAARELHSQ